MRNTLAEYYVSYGIMHGTVQIDGCYDNETKDGQYDFYEAVILENLGWT